MYQGSRIGYRGSRIGYRSSRIKDQVSIPNFVHLGFPTAPPSREQKIRDLRNAHALSELTAAPALNTEAQKDLFNVKQQGSFRRVRAAMFELKWRPIIIFQIVELSLNT